MLRKVLRSLAVIAFYGCFTSTASAVECPTGQQDYNGVCKPLRTASSKPAPFVPVPIRNSQNVFLYPTVMPAKCATEQMDSDCMVAYSYIDTSLPPTITASFTNTSPIAGSTSTSPQWTSTNAVSMSISCSGVASSMAGTVDTQGTPSGITFTSTTAGTETCILTATNPFGTSSSSTIYVAFADPLPQPTITVTRTTGLPMSYPGNTAYVWNSANAHTVTLGCTSANGGPTQATISMGVSGSNGGAILASWVGKTSVCTWTAIGAGGSAVFTETLTTVNAPPTISVSRTPLLFMVGRNFSITWATTNATSVNLVCTSSGTGVTYNGPRNLSGTDTGVAIAAWVGYPTRCVWTATGPGGTATAIDDFSTIPSPIAAPTLSVTRVNGLPMQYPGTTGVSFSSSNATSVTLRCTSPDGGFSLNTTEMGLSGGGTGPTLASWVGKISYCTWTATGAGGTTTVTETLTTVNPPNFGDVYRYRYGYIYYYTACAYSCYLSLTGAGWAYEGVAFRAFTSATSQLNTLKSVYQYYYPPTGARFFTNTASEIADAPNWGGWVLNSANDWYAQADYNSANGAIPVYRVWIPSNESYFLTTSYQEAVNAVNAFGVWDGYAMYAWP